jgi:hypothetical protein
MNKFLKAVRRASAVSAAVVAASAVTASQAFAAIDLSTDITAAKTDVTTNGTAVLGVIVAVAVIMWIRRVLK